MTTAEIKAELLKELPSVQAYICRVTSDNKYRRAALKHTEKVWFKPIFFKSHRGNNYVALPFSKGKSDFKKLGLNCVILCYYFNSKNKIDVALQVNLTDYDIFSGHLIERYAERFLHNPGMNKMDAIINFFKVNCQYSSRSFSSSRFTNSIIGTVTDGVIIGIEENDSCVFKTFITFDMLKGEEIDYNNETSTILEDLQQVCDTKEYIDYLVYKSMFQHKMIAA